MARRAKLERRRIFDWKLAVQVLSMVVVMGGGLLGVFWKMTERLAIVETQIHEQMKGYQIVFSTFGVQINKIEAKVDKLDDKLDTFILRGR